MPRPLSNAEFAQFTTDYPQYNATSTQFAMTPGQSAVVNWNNTGQIVLVYDSFNTIPIEDDSLGYPVVTQYPDVYYTDVSDATQVTALTQPGFTAPPQTMLDALPQAIKDTIAQEAQALGALVDSAGNKLSSYASSLMAGIGGAVGAGLGPIVGSLSPVLIGAVVVLALMYLPKGSK